MNGFKLYYGATYSKPYNGMFSFVPSLPIEAGFERHRISIPNVINGGLNTNFRILAEDNENSTKLYWEETAK